MLDRLTGKPVHNYIQFIGCLGIAAGLPWSKVPLSLSLVLLAINFLLQGDFADVYANFKRKKAFLFFIAFVAIEIISMLWTENTHEAISNLNTRAPLYALPIILIAKPLAKRTQIHWIGLTFILACFITSFINIGSYQHWWGNKVYDDFRGLSLFVSHIRFALLIVFALVLCIGWWLYKLPYHFCAIPLIGWMLFYTYYAQIITGYIALISCCVILAIWLIAKIQSNLVKFGLAAVFLGLTTYFTIWVIEILKPIPHKIEVSQLPSHTLNGNKYWNVDTNFWENGYPIYGCFCPEELEVEWNKRSKVNFNTGLAASGDSISFTLHRYMTSKGLCKDSAGVSKLNENDIKNIENGINSILMLEGGIKSRLYTISYQLQNNSNPNGHSLLERLEYWKAARHLMAENWLLGVGMGDVQDEFNNYYTETNSKLLPENRHRAHQMYFTVIISSGIFAFVFFMLWWIAQIKVALRIQSLTWLCFIAIVLSSFLIEDTLETQLGGAFVSFFFSLYLAHPRWFLRKPVK